MIGKDEMRELHPYINTGDILGGVWIPQVTYILSFDYAHLTPNPKEILFFPLDYPQIFRQKFAEDVERKCYQDCETISISVMKLAQIAK